jgi:hypothetical protein
LGSGFGCGCGLGSGFGFGGMGFFLWKWSRKCFLIGPQMVTDAHSADGLFVLPGTTTKSLSDCGTMADGS